ncbi:hypothetical protein [Methylobacterium soli]|uniref:Uncharacterized protein n=1 Tax=Methylobacterium soli TaxID=553447 RepID=A0A6L3T6T5_9HYPH|nr:hypothetical protein [Methylobacterium soli]KAB1081835.1 hypothetical protein F6X53_01705 [Methylobacterium soli]GJE40950.1 hypothetical protein AEGHOMDF_0109 [Methylobacterium soli]
MRDAAQKRSIRRYRARLGERGLARFEVIGLDADRALVRMLARRLAEDGPEATEIRDAVSRTLSNEPSRTGGILDALRRSPLVGSDIDLDRLRVEGRSIDL